MTDYLEFLNQYRDIKEICDLIDDVHKLRFYYSTQQYDLMLQHIRQLKFKHPIEATIWDMARVVPLANYVQCYLNAEEFLKRKGLAILIDKGYDLSQYFSNE